MEDFFRIGTPAANQEGMKMANKIWDDQVALFNWYNNCDERTLNYRSSDIHYDILFLHYMMKTIQYPDNSLTNRYKELKFDKVALNYAKTLQGQISSQLRKAEIDQQALAGALQELHQLHEIAQLIGDTQTSQKIQGIAAAQIDMMSNLSPEMGAAFRQFYYNRLETPEHEPEVAEEGEIAEAN